MTEEQKYYNNMYRANYRDPVRKAESKIKPATQTEILEKLKEILHCVAQIMYYEHGKITYQKLQEDYKCGNFFDIEKQVYIGNGFYPEVMEKKSPEQRIEWRCEQIKKFGETIKTCDMCDRICLERDLIYKNPDGNVVLTGLCRCCVE